MAERILGGTPAEVPAELMPRDPFDPTPVVDPVSGARFHPQTIEGQAIIRRQEWEKQQRRTFGATPEQKRADEARRLAEEKAAAQAEEARNARIMEAAKTDWRLYQNPKYAEQAKELSPYTDPYAKLAEQYRTQAAPQREYEMTPDVANALAQQRAAAYGWVPSAAEIQLKQGRDMAIQQAMALGASARGGEAQRVGAQRAALGEAGTAMGQYSGQAAQLRAQEMALARAAYVDTALGEQTAAERAASENLEATLRTRALGAQTGLAYEDLIRQTRGMGMAEAARAADLYSGRQIEADRLRAGIEASERARAFEREQAKSDFERKLLGYGLEVGGSALDLFTWGQGSRAVRGGLEAFGDRK